MVQSPLILGAVAYDQKVVPIWEGFTRYFEARGLPFDVVLYSNYERQVRAHLAGHIHIAWNSPLAWIEAERLAAQQGRTAQAVAMRDTDRDLTSIIVVKEGAGIDSLADLCGRRVAVGASDSPQATLIPLDHIAAGGTWVELLRFDIGVGLHGDHIGGERDAAKALMAGQADACCILDANRLLFAREGTLPTGATRVLAQTEPFDHCNFTVLDGAPVGPIRQFVELLLGMSYADPQVRLLLDMEGLKQWLPGRTHGYAALNRAVDRFGTLTAFLAED